MALETMAMAYRLRRLSSCHNRQSSSMRLRFHLSVLLVMVLGNGCALFRMDLGKQPEEQSREAPKVSAKSLDGAVPVKRIARLSSSLIVQPVYEKRVRDQVWEEMSEIVFRERQVRRRLNESGFRVAVSGPQYPWALDNLLSTAQHDQRRQSNADQSQLFFSASGGGTGPSIVVPEEGESLVEIRRGTAAEIPADVNLPGLSGVDPAEQIRCMLRIQSVEYNDDRAVIRFLPELHFGSKSMRLTVTDGDDRLQMRQKRIPLFDQQFELRLHPDDAVVMGYNDQEEWTVGKFFFQSTSVSSAQQHLLVLKLSEIETIEGQRSLQVQRSKY